LCASCDAPGVIQWKIAASSMASAAGQPADKHPANQPDDTLLASKTALGHCFTSKKSLPHPSCPDRKDLASAFARSG
jgi:hypothetical protein